MIDSRNNTVKRHALSYIVATLTITYLCWLSFLYAHFKTGVEVFGDSPLGILMVIGLFSPTLMGVAFSIKEEGMVLNRPTANQIKGFFTYMPLAILLPFAFVLLDVGQDAPNVVERLGAFSKTPIKSVLSAFALSIVFGGLEELGWRGYLLPRLLTWLSPLKATLLISVIWAVWHIPLFFLPGAAQYQNNFLVFFMGTVTLSAIMTFLWIKTRSTLLAILTHTTFNAMAVLGYVSGSNADITISHLATSTSIALVSIALLNSLFYKGLKRRKSGESYSD